MTFALVFNCKRVVLNYFTFRLRLCADFMTMAFARIVVERVCERNLHTVYHIVLAFHSFLTALVKTFNGDFLFQM